MKQRVKLAQALVHDPQLVLLDEPTNGLDPAGRDDMLGLIRRIGTEFGISVLVTSHLLGELERVCDHVVVIDGGRLLRSSSTADVTAASQLIAVEVTERTDELAAALQQAGLGARPAGALLEVDLQDDTTYDIVRDAVAALGVGLIRMERRRHRMSEIFTTPRREPLMSTTCRPRESSTTSATGTTTACARAVSTSPARCSWRAPRAPTGWAGPRKSKIMPMLLLAAMCLPGVHHRRDRGRRQRRRAARRLHRVRHQRAARSS